MERSGTLRSWDDDRGFGFIAPKDGGRELFVHISAFPRDGTRPTAGESLRYELGTGKDGRPQAVRVYRQALGHPSGYPKPPPRRFGRPPSVPGLLLGFVLMAGLAAYGYHFLQQRASRPDGVQPAPTDATAIEAAGVTSGFRCDGRKYCSQMTSCAEARYFLKNCPGVEMDGDHDGTPCEAQWCTSMFAK